MYTTSNDAVFHTGGRADVTHEARCCVQTTAHSTVWHLLAVEACVPVDGVAPLLAQPPQPVLHEQGAAHGQTRVIFHVDGGVPHGEDGVADVLDQRAVTTVNGMSMRTYCGSRRSLRLQMLMPRPC